VDIKRKTGFLYLVLAAFAALMLLVAACGGDDDDSSSDDSGDDAAATTPADDGGDDGGEETPDNGGDDSGDDSGDDGGDDSGDNPFSDLQGLTEDFENVVGKVTYETGDETGTTGTMTLYSDPPNNRSRFDTSDDSGGVFILISTQEATYTCTASDASGSDGLCITGEGSEDAGNLGLFGLFTSPALLASYVDDLAGIDVSQSSEEVAGQDAECFAWEGDFEGESGSGKICLADNGLMLSADFEGSDGTTTHMQATDVSFDVSDSDFEPPFEEFDVGDLGQ
jgi:hypothetical protein